MCALAFPSALDLIRDEAALDVFVGSRAETFGAQLAVEFVDPRSKQADQSAEHVNATDALLCAGNVMRRARARSEQKNKRSNETEFSHWSQSPRERFLGT